LIDSVRKPVLALIIVLAALIVVSGAGLLRGERAHGSSSSSLDSPLVHALRARLITEGPAEPAEFQCPCRSGSSFRFGVIAAPAWSAEATVATSKTQVRKAPFRLVAGEKADIRYEPAGKDTVPVKVSLKTGEAQEFSILRSGGVLKFRCVAPAPQDLACVIRLE
jgi:hypothetical protein